MYPYFNYNGLYWEKQNGPHPNLANIPLDKFSAGEWYTVAFWYGGQ